MSDVPQNNSSNLLSDFHRILELFDRENQIYKQQISILKDSVAELQIKEETTITNMARELSELKTTIQNLIPTSNTNISTNQPRELNDYLCQICLDSPRDCLLEPCMHFCICVGCVVRLVDKKCPVCRREIDFYQNVFIS